MRYLVILGILNGCGYQSPKDQCVGKGTECHGQDTSSQSGDSGNNPGPQGPVGPVGNTGTPGASGRNGQDGKSCTIKETTGGAEILCPDSEPVEILNGQNGVAGAPGTLILPIKFCPGESVYPSTFVENGFCIDGKLYAVYSQNGGFMAEIPPGTYNSNAIGSSCNFTVLTNCRIQ